MPLQAFSVPFPQTRFFKAGTFIYKFKIRGGSSYRGDETVGGTCLDHELEEIIRTVLSNLDTLQPFSSTHFSVFPYKKRWEGISKVMCKHRNRNLRAYPFILILYLERNGKQAEEKLIPENEVAQQIPSVSEPQSKRHKRESPLEEAILKDLETETKASVVRLHVDNPHAGEEVKEEVKDDPGHADKKSGVSMVIGCETSGEGNPGTIENMDKEEGLEEGEEDSDSAHESPVKPGILARLASSIFPFSFFFRDT
uniref:membrane-anchored junction protein isoform X2 n=1 Tax=Scatophagus argus TaxID=75038 RepID=UPI001ED81727|nr:membrane-anchored junction protein isoform X2 [Scatophagus argus]